MAHPSENFYLSQSEPNRSCLLALRTIILKQSDSISETINYGMPCFCYHKKILCYLWTDKKTGDPYILMVDGKEIEHTNLEIGSRSRMKIFRINPNKNIPLAKIQEVLKLALNIARSK